VKGWNFIYLLSLLSSIIYFLIVSFTLLSNWVWNVVVGDTYWWGTLEGLKIVDWIKIQDHIVLRCFYDYGERILHLLAIEPVHINNQTNFIEYFNIGDWVNVAFGVDGMSLSLIILTAFIIPLCLLYCWRNVANRESISLYLIFLEILLIIAFWTRDIIVFFIVFEIILWPMYKLILAWGSHEQKKKAAMSFILYTIFGSLILLMIIISLMSTFKTTSVDVIIAQFPENEWSSTLLWIPAFVAFAIKVPTFPFHHWLTLAHVEAPTVGSVILAALLLKLGSYGFRRYMLPVFNDQNNFELFMPIVATLCLLSVIFAALMAISQSDLKRIVAYSSIAHMNFSLLGLMSITDRAIVGGIVLFIAHGFVSAAMFFSVGMIYDRYHQRDLLYFRGLASIAPVFSVLYFMINLANLGIPITFNFLGEFLIFTEVLNIYHFAAPLLILALIIQVGYTMKLVSILFGDTVKFPNATKLVRSDITLHEIIILVLLTIPTYYFGVRGEQIIDYMTLIDPMTNHVDTRYVLNLEAVMSGENNLTLALNRQNWALY
jgi:NADH-quinone oxidoreductase subunit M